jgi:hypothetical protein
MRIATIHVVDRIGLFQGLFRTHSRTAATANAFRPTPAAPDIGRFVRTQVSRIVSAL